ncbi:MAG: hypothetical protein AMJ58_03365 [Gammaproteobacteria bacterium SG8_30]|nr:MAG: hypothetical protein AMJ58_03365 [Gammaproteobacteria bacterium SG8_30]
MQRLPAPAQPAHRGARRSGRERHQEQQPGQADRDVGARDHVLGQHPQIEAPVHDQVEGEVAEQIEERGQAQHAAESHPVHPARDLPEGRDAQGDEEEVETPLAEAVEHGLHWIGAEAHAAQAGRPGCQMQEGCEAGQQQERLEHEAEGLFLREHRQKFLARSIPE